MCVQHTHKKRFSSPTSLSLSEEEATQFPAGEAKFAWHYVLNEMFLGDALSRWGQGPRF